MNSWIKNAAEYFSGLRSPREELQGVRVLAFHGVLEKKTDMTLERNLHLLSNFKDQIRILRQYQVISLSELHELINQRKPINSKMVVITFDDGYANNLLAGEILQTEKLPWSLFLTAGEVGENRCIWPVELSLLLLHGEASKVEWNEKKWSLRKRSEREIAFKEIRYSLKALPAVERQEALSAIRMQFPEDETNRLLKKFPSLAMLSWKQVDQLASSGVEMGSHGWTHELHHPAQSRQARIYELKESRAEIARRLSRPCRFFAYPNGDFMDNSAQEVREEGYDFGFTTRSGTVTTDSNQWLLPRLEISDSTRLRPVLKAESIKKKTPMLHHPS